MWSVVESQRTGDTLAVPRSCMVTAFIDFETLEQCKLAGLIEFHTRVVTPTKMATRGRPRSDKESGVGMDAIVYFG